VYIIKYCKIFWYVVWYTPLIRRFLFRMIGFISRYVTHALLITLTHRKFSAIADLHSFHYFQFTVTHTLGFPVSTSRLLAMNLNRETTTVSHSKYYT
jgi:hypothetical protein